MRVLVADDEPAIGTLVSAVLRTLGCQFKMVHDGRAVLDSLEQESPFDLLISDILMPNVDGITLVEQVKKAYPTTPILLISGHPDLCAKARQVGADWCLEKPFSYYDLLTAVEEVLKHRA